ncbi:Hypothetical predicted protein [Paramuricea clavata]|uniref:Uncharacterized protein n=1 Tax=Paramuricea clavata TaxID=317549 RepID=A0A7D9LR52_PARCT|nr:Hypothetical predicted protein [Paramuricea clavata]
MIIAVWTNSSRALSWKGTRATSTTLLFPSSVALLKPLPAAVSLPSQKKHLEISESLLTFLRTVIGSIFG